MKDDFEDNAPSAVAEPEPAPAPRSEMVEPPSWSIMDAPEPPEEELLDTSQSLDIESDIDDEPLPDMDSELFIEREGELPGNDEISMLRQIPIEEVELSQDLEIELDLEVQEEEIEEPAPAQRASVTAPERKPAASATSKDYEIEDDASKETSHEKEMRRMKQSGGESRLLRDVKLHFRMRDWQGAVPLLGQLIVISPGKALYRGMLARAMSRNPATRKDAEEHFIEALRLSPQDPELHYWLGLYYKSFGLKSRALTEFRTTLRINAKHEGARKQLGGGRKKDDALGNVFKKLFG
jgi:tetratricopeptide (TPR) repeat protein